MSWPVLDCEAVTPEEEKALKSGFMAKLQARSVELFVRKRGGTTMESVQITWFYHSTVGWFGPGAENRMDTEAKHVFSRCPKRSWDSWNSKPVLFSGDDSSSDWDW